MWFERMTLEVWFDDYQFAVNYDIGESAVKFLTVDQLDIDLQDVALRYGYHTGQPPLRAALAEQYPGLTPDQIVVTAGASEANFAVVSASVKPGDHVIVEHPNYPSLYDVPRSLGCDVSLFHLRFEEGFRPDLDRLEQMVTPGTRLISFTHPNNPTGSMMSESDLLRLVEFVEEKDIFLMFDETYIHYAENTTQHNRIILFCDIERPMKYRWAAAFNRWFSRNVMAAAGSPNDAGDKTGGLNRAFTRLYKIRLRGKELKKRNRTRYYLEKWAIFAVLALIFILI